MLIFPNKSRYGVSSPRYPPIFIYCTFFSYFHSEFIFLSTSRTEWKKNWWVRKHRSASRVCLSFIASVPRFSPLSLSLSLSLLPFSSQETSTSPFSFPIGGNGLRFFNGVPLVWWEICFKPVVVSLACSANLSKFEGFVENSLLSEGCCTNFYLSANFEELTLMDPFFPSDQVEGRFD